MEGHPPTESESTSSVLRDHGGGPSVENQVKVAFAANHTFAKSEEVLSVKEPMEVDRVPSRKKSRKLDDPMKGWVSKVGREPVAKGNNGNRITPAEVPPSEAEKCNVPSKVLVKESICSSADCTLASKPERRKSLMKPIIDV